MKKIIYLLLIGQFLFAGCKENHIKIGQLEIDTVADDTIVRENISSNNYSQTETNYVTLFENLNFEMARPFQENRALIIIDDFYQYIDEKGNLLPFKIKRTSELPGYFQEGRAEVYTKSNTYGFIDLSGKLVIDTIYRAISGFSNSLAMARREGWYMKPLEM